MDTKKAEKIFFNTAKKMHKNNLSQYAGFIKYNGDTAEITDGYCLIKININSEKRIEHPTKKDITEALLIFHFFTENIIFITIQKKK